MSQIELWFHMHVLQPCKHPHIQNPNAILSKLRILNLQTTGVCKTIFFYFGSTVLYPLLFLLPKVYA